MQELLNYVKIFMVIYMLLSCKNIEKSFQGIPILKNISFKIEKGEKIAIIGVNGAGKSTLLKILTKELDHDAGILSYSPSISIGYLSQHQDLSQHKTIYEALLDEFKDVIAMEQQLHVLEERMSHDDDHESLYKQYDFLLHAYQDKDGYGYERKIRSVLIGLGFPKEQFQQSIETLSGGEKTRVALAKLLLNMPDILLLDEPTNHLDVMAIQWLENYLRNYPKAIIMISHDRYFIDQIASSILEIEHGVSYQYVGSYHQYAIEKKKRRDIELKHYLDQQKQIKKIQESIDTLKSFNREKSIRRAESKEKQLQKIDVLEKPLDLPGTLRLPFHIQKETGHDVLTVKNVAKSFDHPLFSHCSFEVHKHDRVALIGPNGIGKTTLLKILMHLLPLDSGSIRYGSNVEIGYYDQEQRSLSLHKTIFQEISDTYPRMTNTEIRQTLALFLFKEEDVFKEISVLSGGERSRVVLAKLLLSSANFLILDEPTNHLDIYSKEVLEEALRSFPGTILFISHDRYFINTVATKIVELGATSTHVYLGNYDHYLEKRNVDPSIQDDDKNMDYETRKKEKARLRKKENEIKKWEEKISELETYIQQQKSRLLEEDILQDYVQYNDLNQHIEKLEEELNQYLETWEQLNESLENDV